MKRKKNSVLKYIEYDIVGHCNLNCKGCSHFSNLQKEEEFVDLKSYEKDIKRLHELFSKIERIKILGGEPLLHPQIGVFITITRQILKDTRIDIVTNGLLIGKLNPEVLETIKDCNAKLVITMYKNTERIKKQIIERVEEYQLEYEIYEEKNEFRRQLTKEKRNRGYASHEKCGIKNCTGIKNGLLGKCPMSIHIDRFNKRFNSNFPENEFIDIHDKEIKNRDIKKFIKKPIELCKYCSTKHEFFQWEQANYEEAKEEDWFSKYNEGTEKENIKAIFICNMKAIWKSMKKNGKTCKKLGKKLKSKIKKEIKKIYRELKMKIQYQQEKKS